MSATQSSLAQATAALIALAVALACARLAWRRWQARQAREAGAPAATAPTPLAVWLLLLFLQPMTGWLLWRALYPPLRTTPAPVLVVATAATPLAAVRALPEQARLVALPEAPPLPGAQRVPDLATALRTHAPRALHVLGRGLGPRDQAAARGFPLRADLVPLPPGLVALAHPHAATAGLPFAVSGEAAASSGGRVELRDPGNIVIASAPIGASGRFTLLANAPVAGRFEYRVRLVDARARAIESVPLSIDVAAGTQPGILLLAGGPGPEWKYLRRWATDAGLPLQARLPLGGGVELRDAGWRLDAATLRMRDVLVVDERGWRGLDGASRAAVRAAVDDGLGLLLVLGAPPGADERAAWRSFGIALASERVPERVRLPALLLQPGAPLASVAGGDAADAGADADAAAAEGDDANDEADALAEASAPTRQPVRADGDGVQALLADADGRALGAWRPRGRGRVGVLWLGDTYRLVLAGQRDAHARVWATALGTLARARAPAPPVLQAGAARVGLRAVLCGDAGLQLVDPDARPVVLVTHTTPQGRCAAFWPERAGTYLARTRTGGTLRFDVLATQALAGVHARALRDATRALATAAPAAADLASNAGRPATPMAAATTPGARWPWALGWLLVAAAGWALERRTRTAPVSPG